MSETRRETATWKANLTHIFIHSLTNLCACVFIYLSDCAFHPSYDFSVKCVYMYTSVSTTNGSNNCVYKLDLVKLVKGKEGESDE